MSSDLATSNDSEISFTPNTPEFNEFFKELDASLTDPFMKGHINNIKRYLQTHGFPIIVYPNDNVIFQIKEVKEVGYYVSLDSNKSDAAINLTSIAAASALLCLPIPGSKAIAISVIAGSAISLAKNIAAHQEKTKNKDQVSIGVKGEF